MSSIHFPVGMSAQILHVQTNSRQNALLAKDTVYRRSTSKTTNRHDGRLGLPQTEAEEQQHFDAKRAPSSFPPLRHSRDDDAKKSSSGPERSMAEVVARMRVREKTLMGEDLLRRRRTEGSTGHDVLRQSAEGSVSVLQGKNTLLPPSYVGLQGLSISSAQGANSSDVRTRQFGVVDQVRWDWDTARDGIQGARTATSPSHLARGIPTNGVNGVNGHFSEGRLSQDYHLEGGEQPTSQETVRSLASDDSDDDDDFDFDEGEEQVAAEREAGRRSRETGVVYQRACETLRVQPSPAFLRQAAFTSMDLRDVRLGPVDVKPIAIALVRDCKIYNLDLSNNDLGPIGVSYIAEMLQENTTLYDLNLSATNPGREGVKALSETLRHNQTLGVLRLEENGIEHTESHLLADMIRCVPRLQSLYLGHNRLGYTGGVAIASAIAQNKSMLTLDLQWNHIRRDSAVALVRSLQANTCLRTLNLAWNGLGKEGCLALAHALPKNSTLRELDVTCNRVDLMSLGFLLKGLTRNSSLQSIKIGQNPLTTEGAKALLKAVTSAPNVNISEIDIGGVPVDVDFTNMLSRAQRSRILRVKHEEAVTLATSDQKREHDGTNLDRYDPVMVFFEYMKLDNLRVIDMFQFMDTKKRDKLSKGNIRDGLNTLKIPVTEHAIDVIFQKLDINKDGFVELDEMMKMQRDTARQVKLRQIKAKAKNKEDAGLNGLHKTLRDIISKRKEDKEPRKTGEGGQATTTKTSGGKKTSVGGLLLTQPRFTVTSSKRRVENSDQQPMTSPHTPSPSPT